MDICLRCLFATATPGRHFDSRRCRSRNHRRRSRAGFTLIELMVVVGIISILTAMAVPSYSAIRRRVYDAAALSDVVNASRAMEGIDGTVAFRDVVRGPGPLPSLPGPMVSPGVRLMVRRRVNRRGRVFNIVRGDHRQGTMRYFIRDGVLSAQTF